MKEHDIELRCSEKSMPNRNERPTAPNNYLDSTAIFRLHKCMENCHLENFIRLLYSIFPPFFNY